MSATSTAGMPPWITGWTAQQPFHLDYSFVPGGSPWTAGPKPGMQQRDLGLARASSGKMTARHMRIANPALVPTDWLALESDFNFMYVTAGQATLENGDGQRMRLQRGTATWQPAFMRYRIFDYSPDFEMFEMLAPAEPRVISGRDTPLPERAREFAHLKGQYLAETPDSYEQGAGPRKFFRYRDLGTTAVTDGRIHIHVVEAAEPMPGGTGWHTHTMRQLFWVFSGSAGFEIEGHPEVKRVHTHDAVCVTAGQRHDVPDFTADYRLIEVCMPARYDTINAEPPAR